jgi:hypothetical protein
MQVEVSGFVADEAGTYFDSDLDPSNLSNAFVTTGACTGFVINPNGYIATAAHCVDVGPHVQSLRDTLLTLAIQQVDPNYFVQLGVTDPLEYARTNFTVEGKSPGTPPDVTVTVHMGGGTGNGLDGESLRADIIDVGQSDRNDIAVLKIAGTDLPSAELAADADVQQGAPVLAVGYPGNRQAAIDLTLEPTFKDGQVSSRTTSAGVPVYELSAAVSPGMSGGPTVGSDGRVYGVNSFSAVNVDGTAADGINFAITAAQLSDMLTRNNIKAELGPLDRTYREGLTLYWNGEYTEAVAKFDEVISRSPAHRQAQEFKTNALRNRDQFGDAGIDAMWYYVGAGALLLIILIGVGLTLLLRRRARVAPAPVPPSFYPPPGSIPPQRQGFNNDYYAASRAAPTQRYCPGCGTVQQPAARFCATCGTAIGTDRPVGT